MNKPTFSNGTECTMWQERNCFNCTKYENESTEIEKAGCPIAFTIDLAEPLSDELRRMVGWDSENDRMPTNCRAISPNFAEADNDQDKKAFSLQEYAEALNNQQNPSLKKFPFRRQSLILRVKNENDFLPYTNPPIKEISVNSYFAAIFIIDCCGDTEVTISHNGKVIEYFIYITSADAGSTNYYRAREDGDIDFVTIQTLSKKHQKHYYRAREDGDIDFVGIKDATVFDCLINASKETTRLEKYLLEHYTFGDAMGANIERRYRKNLKNNTTTYPPPL